MTDLELENLVKAQAEQKAAELWAGFDRNERALVRFGMFPADKMQRAEAEIIAGDGPLPPRLAREVGRLLSLALMGIAEKNGGMVA